MLDLFNQYISGLNTLTVRLNKYHVYKLDGCYPVITLSPEK